MSRRDRLSDQGLNFAGGVYYGLAAAVVFWALVVALLVAL